MYLNTNNLPYNGQNLNNGSHMLVPQSQPFMRSHSDAANNEIVKNEEFSQNPNNHGPTNGHEAGGVRMKRYNSLPDVADFLDPNAHNSNSNLSNVINNNNFSNNSAQLDSLIAAFNHGNRKMYTKPNSYFMPQDNDLPQIITTSASNDQLASHSYDQGLAVPLSAGLSVSSHENLDAYHYSHSHSSAPHSPVFATVDHGSQSNVDWSQTLVSPNMGMNGEPSVTVSAHGYDGNLVMDQGSIQQRRKRLMTEEPTPNLVNDISYSQAYQMGNQMQYQQQDNLNLRPVSGMDMMGSAHISPISPHFPPNQHQFQQYYPGSMMMHNQLKRARQDDSLSNGLFSGHNFMEAQQPNALYSLPESLAMSMHVPMQSAPAPDAATAHAAQEAINAASHIPPPTDDSDPEAIPRRQHLRYPGDLYTPQWVRYGGHKKEGYCDLCNPGKWLQLKNSAYWYHKQFYHGISSVSGKFFSGPIQTRQKDPEVVEGLCHQCQQWIQMSSAKRRNSVLWFRHAHKCHVYHKPKSLFGKKN